MKSEALIEFRKDADELEIVGSGSWTAVNASRLDALIGAEPPLDHGRVRVDMGGVRDFDTYGAWLLARLLREFGGADLRLPSGLPDRFRGFFESDRFRDLFEKAHEADLRAGAKRDRRNWLLVRFEGIGRSIAGAVQDVVRYLSIVGAFVIQSGEICWRSGGFVSLRSSISSTGSASGPFRLSSSSPCSSAQSSPSRASFIFVVSAPTITLSILSAFSSSARSGSSSSRS